MPRTAGSLRSGRKSMLISSVKRSYRADRSPVPQSVVVPSAVRRKDIRAALGLLSLAAALRSAGFEPKVIDGALDADYLEMIRQEIGGCLAFGISLLTGPMIRDAT